MYITVRDGSFVKIDRQSYIKDTEANYVIFTQLNGFGQSGMGVIKQASVIDINWVKHLIPLLKDPIDAKRLSGIINNTHEQKSIERREDLE